MIDWNEIMPPMPGGACAVLDIPNIRREMSKFGLFYAIRKRSNVVTVDAAELLAKVTRESIPADKVLAARVYGSSEDVSFIRFDDQHSVTRLEERLGTCSRRDEMEIAIK